MSFPGGFSSKGRDDDGGEGNASRQEGKVKKSGERSTTISKFSENLERRGNADLGVSGGREEIARRGKPPGPIFKNGLKKDSRGEGTGCIRSESDRDAPSRTANRIIKS